MDREKFKYEIPENASIRTAEKAKRKTPSIFDDRELLITVANAKDAPIGDATVRTSSGGFELEMFSSNESGQVRSKNQMRTQHD